VTEPAWVAATRASYDALAAHDPAVVSTTDLAARVLDRAMLAAFAACVTEAGDGPVLDLGCGPGHVTRVLADLGLDAAGVDVSPAMVARAREAHPGLEFAVGDLRTLPAAAVGYAGLLAHHSLVHVPWDERPAVLAHLAGLLAAGGHLMAVVLVGDDTRHVTEHQGLSLDLTWYRQRPEALAEMIAGAGLDVRLTATRAAERGRAARPGLGPGPPVQLRRRVRWRPRTAPWPGRGPPRPRRTAPTCASRAPGHGSRSAPG
jgi:SAM-dependent methyltransferase